MKLLDKTQEAHKLWPLIHRGWQHALSAQKPTWVDRVFSAPALQESTDYQCIDDSVIIERQLVTESYLSSLREQIHLNARGEEWTAILDLRLRALLPYVGQELIAVAVRHDGQYACVRYTPD